MCIRARTYIIFLNILMIYLIFLIIDLQMLRKYQELIKNSYDSDSLNTCFNHVNEQSSSRIK